ncbi:28565_t:CDS:2, partial [Dentiscutata erythropus]
MNPRNVGGAGTINADDGYFISNNFVFNVIDGHYAIVYFPYWKFIKFSSGSVIQT